MNQRIVSQTFSASMEIDVASLSHVVYVGGGAKGFDLPNMTRDLKILKEFADKSGKTAQAFFDAGTPEEVLEAAGKVLGKDNVRTFLIIDEKTKLPVLK